MMEDNNEKNMPKADPAENDNRPEEHPKEEPLHGEEVPHEEPPHEEPHPAHEHRPEMHDERSSYHEAKPVNPPRHHMHINWELIGKLCVAAIFCGACGFAGGAIANYTGVGEREDVQEQQYYAFPGFGFGDEFDMPDRYEDRDDGEHDERDLSQTPVLGVTVRRTQGDEGVDIIAISDESKADEAGLAVGDRIVEADGEKIEDNEDLADVLEDKNVGDTIKIKAQRDDKDVEADVELISKASLTSDTNRRA